MAKVSLAARAEAQAEALKTLAPHLTPAETAAARWGRNAQTGRVPERLRARGSVYRDATALEVLVGLTYVTDPPRLAALMALLGWDDHALGGPADPAALMDGDENEPPAVQPPAKPPPS